MNEQPTYGDFNSNDIKRYLSGQMGPEEMHQIERAALEDHFLADAIEGYELHKDIEHTTHHLKLQERLAERVEASEKTSFNWWRIAAIFILVLGASTAVWYLSKPSLNHATLARNEELRSIVPKEDTKDHAIPKILPVPVDTGFNAAITSVEKKQDIKAREQQIINQVENSAKKLEENNRDEMRVKDKIAENDRSKASSSPNADILSETKVDRPASVPSILKETEISAPSKIDDTRRTTKAKQAMAAPSFYFKGKVIDENNKPIPYASVRISNSLIGTYSDVQGNFSLVTSDSVLNAEVVSIGYEKKLTMLVARKDKWDIILRSSGTALSEVVVSSGGKSSPIPSAIEKKDEAEGDTAPYAEPTDGWLLYETYIKNNLRLPQVPQTTPYKGMVTVSFLADPATGKLSDFNIDKSLDPLYDREAIRVLKNGPKWEVYNSDKKVRAYYSIRF